MKSLFMLFLFVFILISTFSFAWDDCPYGQENESYPGQCGLYQDTNHNDICDLSEKDPTIINNLDDVHDLISGTELKTKTVEEVAKIYNIKPDNYAKELSKHFKISVDKKDSFQLLHDNYGVSPSIAKNIALELKTGIVTLKEDSSKYEGKTYHLIPITILILLLFTITKVSTKMKKLKLATHRMIWNVALLITFLISGLLGVLLIIRINFNLTLPIPFNILFWHAEVGIAMVIISIIHITERWSYFKHIFFSKTN